MSSYFLVGEFSAWFRRIVVLFIVISMAIGSARVVLAHSNLILTDPEDGQVLSEPPEEVWAWFSEELDSHASKIRVFDSQNQQVDSDDGGVDLNDMDHKSMVVNLPQSLPEGIYTVHWAAASADDGDTTEGAFYFTVGTASGASETAGQTPASINIRFAIGIGAGLLLMIIAAFFIARRRTPSE